MTHRVRSVLLRRSDAKDFSALQFLAQAAMILSASPDRSTIAIKDGIRFDPSQFDAALRHRPLGAE